MKRLFLGLFLLFGLAIGLVNIVDVKAGGEVSLYTLTVNYNVPGQTPAPLVIDNRTYGQVVTVNAPSQGSEYEFAGIVVDGKVAEGLSESFRIYEDTIATVYYKPVNTKAVIVKDTNNDQLLVIYTGTDGLLSSADQALVAALSTPTKPGLTFSSWSVSNFSSPFISDTVVYPVYTTSLTALSLTVSEGTGAGTYDFNDVVTVTSTNSSGFSYWLKDGLIASLDTTYTFTMAKNHVLEAVYDASFTADSDSFVGVSEIYEDLNTGYATIVGQFVLPAEEELVEWGIITSQMAGGITLDTPDVKVFNSSKFNSGTNEFVMSYTKAASYPNYRAFVKTINTSSSIVTTTYSYYQENTYASDLIISEYGESGSYKYLELFNGTNININLSSYSLKLYANGGLTPSNTTVLSGILLSGQTLPITTATVLNFNGNDAIELLANGVVIDIIGKVGDAAIYGEDVTLQRKSSVLSPNTTFTVSEWNEYPINDVDLGSHQMDLSSLLATKALTPSTITINDITSINAGNSLQLSVTYPVDSLEGVLWSSSNSNIVSINKDTGMLTAVAEGTATVTAYSYYDHSTLDTLEITVLPGSTTYTVTYNLDGGTNDSSNPINFTGSQLPITLGSPTKEGFTFEGWFTDSGFMNRIYDLEAEQNYVLYAKFVAIPTNEETVLYTTGFESTEGFTASTTYNNTALKYTGPIDEQWGTYYGTPSATGPLSGAQSMQMRWYTSAPDNLGYTFMDFDINNVSKVVFSAKNYRGLNVTVSYSTDGGINFTGSQLFTLSTTSTVYTYLINSSGVGSDVSVRIKFQVSLPTVAPTDTAYLYIDDVSVYGFIGGGSTEPTVDTTPPEIVLDSYRTSYELNEPVVLGCTAVDNVDPAPTCTYTGVVDNTVLGDYNVIYTASDDLNNTSTLVVTYTIHAVNDYLSMDLSTYYDNAEGLSGVALEVALRTIVHTGFVGVNYGDSRYILDETDQDPLNQDNLILVYRLTSVPGIWDDGITWNREHVWPQSLLGVSVTNTTINEGSDLHNLKPANPSENSSRGNEYFDNMDTSLSYEPPLESKGDVARILFYMVVMYDNLELVDTEPTIYQMGLLAVLLSWHELDPVDDFERNRNNVIDSYQHNRNPFIDYPHLVELMFEDHPYYN